MDEQELERIIAMRYARIIGKPPVGLIDTLRILASKDMRSLTLDYLASKEG